MVKPRWMYFAYFSFRAVSIGRFSSVFYLDRDVDPAEMGLLFAGDALIGALATAVTTAYVDKQLAKGVLRAREFAIRRAFAFSTLCFCLQCVIDLRWAVPRSLVFRASRWLNAVAFSPCSPIIDAHCLAILAGDRARYGEERLFGAVSWAMVNMVLGFAMDWHGSWIMYPSTAVFGLLAVGMMSLPGPAMHAKLPRAEGAAAVAGVAAVNSGEESPTAAARGAGSANVSGLRLLRTYVNDPKVFSFLFAVFCLGMGMSLVENLLFLLFVQDLGSSNALCGFSVVVTVAFEIPIFWVGKPLLERFGCTVLFSVGLVCYVVRAIGYTICPNGWCVIAFEPLHGVTFGCTALASVEYIARITPKEQLTTGQGIMSSVKQGLGYFLGTLSGGLVIQAFGERTLYRGAAGLVFIGLLLFLHGRTLPDGPCSAELAAASSSCTSSKNLGEGSAPALGKAGDDFGFADEFREESSCAPVEADRVLF